MNLIIGSDSLIDFPKWKDHKEILELAEIVVAKRPGFETNLKDHQEFNTLNSSMLNISSTIVRSNIKKGLSIDGLISLEVKNYINNNKLYT